MTLPLAILFSVIGILSVSFFPSVNFSYYIPLAFAISVFLLSVFFHRICWLKKLQFLGFLVIGITWGVYSGQKIVEQQLDTELEGQDFWVEGVISDLPEDKARYQRFVFSLDKRFSPDPLLMVNNEILPKTLLLSWYGSENRAVGERWRLKVKLKRPRGSVNEGGFDYQRWLLSQGIGATGYVKDSIDNQYLGNSSQYVVNQLRGNIREWIGQAFEEDVFAADSKNDTEGVATKNWVKEYNTNAQLDTTNKNGTHNLLVALAVGDNSLISQSQWQLLRKTGTSHLMAISGLHIGLVAIFGFFIGMVIRALLSLPFSFVRPIYYFPTMTSILLATSYASLAGFSLPTQRALVMVLVANTALVIHRKVGSFLPFLWALLIVVVMDPLAGYELGFWLSFSAVGSLLYAFGYRTSTNVGLDADIDRDKQDKNDKIHFHTLFFNRTILWLKQLTQSQWVVFIGLLLPLILLNQSSSYLSPIANLLAIPWVSFSVVIPLLLAVFLHLLSLWLQPVTWLSNGVEAISDILLQIADASMAVCWNFLAWLPTKSGELLDLFVKFFPAIKNVFTQANASNGFLFFVNMALAIVGVFLLLSPKGVPFKRLGLLLILPLFFSKTFSYIPFSEKYFFTQYPLIVTVLDVGQGLSVVIRAGDKTLLYDTGPGNGGGFNAGDAIVLPFFKSQSINHLDTLIVSHNDNDHVGGAQAILQSLPIVEQFIYGEKSTWRTTQYLIKNKLMDNIQSENTENYLCDKNQHWIWNEVSFYLIEPKSSILLKDKNNQSCVLMVSYKDEHILLAGDIEQTVEQILLRDKQLPSKMALLIAPHHGSKTSSSASFVHYLKPKAVVFSAGFNSRYGHPHPTVIERYRSVESRLFNTGIMGQLEFRFDKDGVMTTTQWRKDHRRYWFSRD